MWTPNTDKKQSTWGTPNIYKKSKISSDIREYETHTHNIYEKVSPNLRWQWTTINKLPCSRLNQRFLTKTIHLQKFQQVTKIHFDRKFKGDSGPDKLIPSCICTNINVLCDFTSIFAKNKCIFLVSSVWQDNDISCWRLTLTRQKETTFLSFFI